MKNSQKISDSDVASALNFLATNWRHDPLLQTTIGSILKKLKADIDDDKQSASILENYLSYPGSDIALKASMSLHAAVGSQQGRRAAGLPPMMRKKYYTAKLVKHNDKVMEILVKYELGKATEHDVESAAIGYLGAQRDKKTIDKFIEELRPRAKEWASFFAALESAAEDNRGLY